MSFIGQYLDHVIRKFTFSLQFSNIIDYPFKSKFLNTLFYRVVNNYYANDFFLRNSKVMSLTAIKTYAQF